jgi:hypothetical protein
MNVIRLVVRSHTRLVDSHQRKNLVDCSPTSAAIFLLQNAWKTRFYIIFTPNLTTNPLNMPPRLVESQRAAVVAHLEAQMNPYDVAHTTGVSYNHVMRIQRNLKTWGTPEGPSLLGKGRKKTLTAEMDEVYYSAQRLLNL